MIGDDQLIPQRLYGYKNNTVVIVLGIAEAEKNKIKIIIYKDCLNPTDYAQVVNTTEFCNHATLINNQKEIEAIDKLKVEEDASTGSITITDNN